MDPCAVLAHVGGCNTPSAVLWTLSIQLRQAAASPPGDLASTPARDSVVVEPFGLRAIVHPGIRRSLSSKIFSPVPWRRKKASHASPELSD